jgi:Ca-activated chloride channel family protein
MRWGSLLLSFGLLLSAMAADAQSIDLRVPFDRLMDEGQSAYLGENYEEAASAFRSARLLRPNSPEAIMNLGLAEAKLGNLQAARELFRESRRFLAPEDVRRSESFYNEGTSWLDEAMRSMESEDPAVAGKGPDLLLEAIDQLGQALELNPEHEKARQNRLAAQNMLYRMEEPPPQDSQESSEEENEEGEQQEQQPSDSSESEGGDESEQQQNQDQQGEGEQSEESPANSDQQNQQQPEDQPSDSQQQENQQSPPQEQESPSDGEPQEESESEPGEEQEGEGEGAQPRPDRPGEMTPEEARQLMNLLGNRDLMIFRQPRDRQPPPSGKDW